MKSPDLAPCPFCREAVDLFAYRPPLTSMRFSEFVVECHNPDCIAFGRVWPRCFSPEEAAAAWNDPGNKRRLAAIMAKADFEKRIGKQ